MTAARQERLAEDLPVPYRLTPLGVAATSTKSTRQQPTGLRWVRLPAGPLLRKIELRGGPAACGVRQHSAEEKALERARRDGWVTYDAADRLAVGLLGLVPCEIWGAEAFA